MRDIAEVHRWGRAAGEWTLATALHVFNGQEAAWWDDVAQLVSAAEEPR